MSSDGCFEDDGFRALAFEKLDEIEAAHFSPPKHPQKRRISTGQSSSEGFESFQIDESELARLDDIIEAAYQGKASPDPKRTSASQAPSGHLVQSTLFGDILSPS